MAGSAHAPAFRLSTLRKEASLPLGDEETEAQAARKHPGLYEMSRRANSQGQEGDEWSQGLDEGDAWGSAGVSSWGDEKALGLDRSDVYTTT